MNLYTLPQLFFDILFPPTREELLVRSLTPHDIHKLYTVRQHDTVHTLSAYTDARVRALIHEAKFHSNTHAQQLLALLLAQYIGEHLHTSHTIIPMPLSRLRFRTRGYNQITEIVRYLPKQIPCTVRENILMRVRDTRPQTELSREERLINVRDAFGVTHGEVISGAHILLIDDVLTTGATMHAAKAALLPHAPASITCIALAH